MPQILYDGDFTVAQIAGSPEFSIPFATDPKPYLYKLKYWQFLNNFVEPALGELGPLGGGYVGGSPGTFKSIGGGVIEFEREYARVPDTRSEWESYVYDYHVVFFTLGLPNYCAEGTPLRLNSRIQFDYFATNDPNTIDLPRAPKLMPSCLGTIQIGEFPTPETPTGTEVQAEDATFKIWKPGIYERQIRFIKWLSTFDLIWPDGIPPP